MWDLTDTIGIGAGNMSIKDVVAVQISVQKTMKARRA